MFLRMLSVMLIALAMLAAPLTMREGEAAASSPASTAMHHGDGKAMPGHCDDQSDSSQDKTHKGPAGNCCVATCVAVVTPASTAKLSLFHPLAERPTSDADRHGTLAEIATPPPRLA